MAKRKIKKRYKLLIIIVSLILLFIVGMNVLEHGLKTVFPTKYSQHVEKYAKIYNLDKNLVYSVIKAESGFDSKAVSPREAKGLMQIMDDTGEWAAGKINIDNYNKDMLLTPETNIWIGCWYLSYLLEQFDQNIDLALASYNAGIGNVSKWLDDPSVSSNGTTLDRIPFEETHKYVLKVKKFIKVYKGLYEKGK